MLMIIENQPIKGESCHHIETIQFIFQAHELACFYIEATLVFNVLRREIIVQWSYAK